MKTIVLIGAGHGHLEVLKSLTLEETEKNKFVLISPDELTYYSGLVPSFIVGNISESQISIESAKYAKQKGVIFTKGVVKKIDSVKKIIVLEDETIIAFDIASVNIGGLPQKIQSDSEFNTIYIRPFHSFITQWNEVKRICSKCLNPSFVVVGGGAAAVEIATALRLRLNENQAKNATVHLVCGSSRICETYSSKISEEIKDSLVNLNIKVYLNEKVDHIFDKHIILKNDAKIDFDKIFISTPNTPSDLVFLDQTSTKDEKEVIFVDNKLMVLNNIFAIGDCSSLSTAPNYPKSGVTAVRQGRHLIKNIRAVLDNKPLLNFSPQKRQLNILITGYQTARLIWGTLTLENTWIYKLKKWIDQKYMNSFKFRH